MSDKINIEDIILPINKIATVNENAFLKEALERMSEFHIGICCIVNNNKIKGIITDGDIRRKILNLQKPFSAFLVDEVIAHANLNPKVLKINDDILNAIKIMEQNKIWDIPIIDNNENFIGLLHLHPVVKKFIL